MRRIVILGVLVLFLSAFNWSIVKKERTLTNGQTMLLRLVPIDPRSLMQGDYMILRYNLARQVSHGQLKAKGRIVVSLDTNGVANFVRIHTGADLAQNEHVLVYRNRKGLRLGAESFFFQEGHAELYSGAQYGELKVDSSGNSVLVGLRDSDYVPLGDAE